MAEYWFNVETHQIEDGPQSDWSKLLGPYTTREDAEKALSTVQANNERWDEDDEDD
ncbi:MAG: SPOR domain-containing protein [Micrococcaceae bacterium]